MPTAPHIRMTALGRLGDGTERFSWSLNLAVKSGPNTLSGVGSNVSDDLLLDTANDVKAFHANAESYIHPRAVLEAVKFAAIGADGLYVGDPTLVELPDTPGAGVGGASGDMVLPQSALAISLTTERRGPTGKGRFYIPMPTVPIGVDLKGEVNYVNAIATQAQTLLNAINNAPGNDGLAGFQVVVSSSKGYNTEVTGVRVGRVIDTIRSRRGALAESYTATKAVS